MDGYIGPVGPLSAEQVRAVLTAASAAPSLHNSQPWRFHCTPRAFELYADRERKLPAADPDGREMLLACGAALCNMRVTLRSMDMHPAVELMTTSGPSDLLAVVRPVAARPATPTDRRLAEAVPRRHTNRRPFADVEVPRHAQAALQRAAELERVRLAPVGPPLQPALRALALRAHEQQQSDPEFVSEWSHWTGRHGLPDGVPARSAGPLPEPQDRWVLRDFSGGRAAERTAGKDFEPSPLIAVVGSFHDTPLGRLQAGQGMQRVLLTATALGLSASFLSQVIEVAAVRRELRALLGGALWPQAVLRLGYGGTVPATPRRGLHEVTRGPQPLSTPPDGTRVCRATCRKRPRPLDGTSRARASDDPRVWSSITLVGHQCWSTAP